ncbi:MAG: hypothetical protein ACP5P4_05860 [Steroidobacteraceae bacterium]
MLTQKSTRRLGFLALATTMAVTRFGQCGSASSLPDASWAVFFIAGVYFASEWRWALPVLLAQAIGIDWAAIHYYGLSDYCATAAYWFIVPAYSLLWLGGAWFSRDDHAVSRDLGRLAIGLMLSVSGCFLLTEGSFYWLSDHGGPASLSGWWFDVTSWYGYFLLTTAGYVVLATLGHLAATRHLPERASLQTP